MTHMVCGYPNLEASEQIFKTLSSFENSEYLEVQFPFSDPLADWPVFEAANKQSIENWMTTEKCFEFVERNIWWKTKILVMTYYNIIFNYWVEKFVKRAKEIGFYGFIIPDVPFDEKDWKKLRELCKKENIVFTELVTPSTPELRLKQISELKPELIYAVSQNMTTGSKAKFWDKFKNYIKKIRKYFDCKIWVWFWIKSKDDISKVCEIADFAIIWTEFTKKYNSWGIDELKKYLEEIKNN